MSANRGHWGIEITHRNKDVILGEDRHNNKSDNAPRNIFSLIGFALKILKTVPPSPTRASMTIRIRPCACSPGEPPDFTESP
jgi:hypothetical protein